MRRLVLLLSALTATLAIHAHADSLTYNLTLIQQTGNIAPVGPGNIVGTGSFTIVSPTSTPGSLNYFAPNINIPNPADPISSLIFSVNGDDYDLTNAGVNTIEISFSSDTLTQILYAGVLQFGKVSAFFNANGGLTYAFTGGTNYSNGFIGATMAQDPSAAAPEPSTFTLFGIGTLGLATLACCKRWI